MVSGDSVVERQPKFEPGSSIRKVGVLLLHYLCNGRLRRHSGQPATRRGDTHTLSPSPSQQSDRDLGRHFGLGDDLGHVELRDRLWVAPSQPGAFPCHRVPKGCPVKILKSPPAWWAAVWTACLSGEGEAVQACNVKHGVVDTVAVEAAVAEDLPCLHAGEDVLDAGSDLLVGLVVFFFPFKEFGLAAFAAVRDDESGAWIAAVGDCEGVADNDLGAGLFPRPAVVAVPGERPADHDDQAGVGVNDDLVVGGVPVVLRPLGDGVVPGGDQPSTMRTVSLANRLGAGAREGVRGG